MRNLKTSFRLAPLLFYGLSVFIVSYAYPIAAKAYNDLCSSQGMTFGEGWSVNFLCMALAIVTVPLFLARSNALILANLIIGLVTVCGAGSILHIAANTPYECFTQAGTYEDHTSGVDGFELWFGFAAAVSYVLLVVDLTIWSVRKLMASQRTRSEPTQSNLVSSADH
ncbi:hypothetical protein [Bradyrhizobium uaiense]|uniref:Uncharacterized protein n=1 Tax=Bradyrhizobium uaiense TaxID=2594946 RepID=A0A6P1B8K7_9BRAD|nr:hypothetical protein [Bradyrhizobium uaiense]NEU94749.1 hypothetical protein [Bradyrhizobium uaiense]